MILREESLEQVTRRLADGNIYCFGAGNIAEKFLLECLPFKLDKQIVHFVDNDENKWGLIKEGYGRSYSIISPDRLSEIIQQNDIIVITCAEYVKIVEQLNCIQRLDNISCYIYIMLQGYWHDAEVNKMFVPERLRLTKDRLIPKVIHYCWFGEKEISDNCKQWMKSWKKYCPDYKIIEWNNHNYDINKNRYMKQAYEQGKWAFVSDYARLDIIYNYGGIYLDTDVELVKNLDDLLYQRGFCGFQNNTEVNLGLGFGTTQGNPIIKKMIDIYDSIDFIMENGELNLTPCPVYQSIVLEKEGVNLDGTYQRLPDMTIYPERVLSGKSQKTRRIYITNKTFSIHHFDASWMDDRSRNERYKRDEYSQWYQKLVKH